MRFVPLMFLLDGTLCAFNSISSVSLSVNAVGTCGGLTNKFPTNNNIFNNDYTSLHRAVVAAT